METQLTKIAGSCDDGPCPALHLLEAGENTVVQLYDVEDSAILDQLDIPAGEIVGWLPTQLILDAADEVRRRR